MKQDLTSMKIYRHSSSSKKESDSNDSSIHFVEFSNEHKNDRSSYAI